MPGIGRDDGKDIAGGRVITGSPDVFVENKPIARVGDLVGSHGRGQHSSPIMFEGSDNIFVNNKKVCREGDKASCGHIITGSGTVFGNDS